MNGDSVSQMQRHLKQIEGQARGWPAGSTCNDPANELNGSGLLERPVTSELCNGATDDKEVSERRARSILRYTSAPCVTK